ncbi:unnamed protein product [Owenia fusiformis]|uniref:Glucosamine 6-phosphate N-acetyltransferase n=1 Tax=Owenia fusiformis TaxID=6347 RepID=A0A8J1U3X3_OWEFU|nr:unnamed protein product [Owenia fusiformis]
MQNGLDDSLLFPSRLLEELDWSQCSAQFKPAISATAPGDNLILRPLQASDYDTGFLQILGQLTSVGDVSREMFQSRFDSMKACKDTYYILVLEDICTSQVIGAASLIVEQKFIHSAAMRGRVEDVVVSKDYRGKQLGKLLVQTLTLLAKHVGCYKVTLECSDDNIKFYNNFGYEKSAENYMVARFKD